MPDSTPLFVYDQDCAFCQRFVDAVRPHCAGAVDFVGSRDYEGAGAEWTGASSVLVFRTPPRVCVESEGIGELLRLSDSRALRLLGRLILAPGCARVARVVYRWVAGHRSCSPEGCAYSP